MRAKRSKKYRKIMSSYNLHFSFRTPYQVLCDSDFLRQCHAFHMPVAQSLANTLHGDARPYITRCSLAKAVAEHNNKTATTQQRQRKEGRGRGDGKPVWLPPPTEVPLRYCKHKDAEGNEVDVVDERECLVDLVGGQARGNEVRKNKNHYVLATAEEEDHEGHTDGQKRKSGFAAEEEGGSRKRRRGPDVRELVRQVPGVPVVYVKRSVMVLEELSGASERVIRGAEKEKLKSGLIGDVRGLKRKRVDGDNDDEDDDDSDEAQTEVAVAPKVRRSKKVKEPNPLSVKKKKVRTTISVTQEGDTDAVGNGQQKKRRKRKRGKKGSGGEQNSIAGGTPGEHTTTVDAES